MKLVLKDSGFEGVILHPLAPTLILGCQMMVAAAERWF